MVLDPHLQFTNSCHSPQLADASGQLASICLDHDFGAVLCCGIIPMILRLIVARRRYHQYRLELAAIEDSCPFAFLTLQSIYSDVQVATPDIRMRHHDEFEVDDSHQHSIIYTQIPFIDDATIKEQEAEEESVV